MCDLGGEGTIIRGGIPAIKEGVSLAAMTKDVVLLRICQRLLLLLGYGAVHIGHIGHGQLA